MLLKKLVFILSRSPLSSVSVIWLREQESNLPVVAYETSEPPLLYSRDLNECGGDEGTRTLIDRFTRPTLCQPVELHRQGISNLRFQIADLKTLKDQQPISNLKSFWWTGEGLKPSQEVCRTSMLSVTSPAQGYCRFPIPTRRDCRLFDICYYRWLCLKSRKLRQMNC